MPGENHFMLGAKTYNFFKQLVQVVFPAFASLYFGLAAIYDLPAAEQVIGTLAVLATFLGATLGISSRNYYASDKPYDGQMVVTTPDDGPKRFSLELDGDPEEMAHKDSITFKVSSPTVPDYEE